MFCFFKKKNSRRDGQAETERRSTEQEDVLGILCAAEEYLKENPKVVWNPYPDYDARVMTVLGTLETDTEYLTHQKQLENMPIEEMSLLNIATMYTFIVRGERFGDGHIASFIENGTLYKLVLRHLQLVRKDQ